MEKHHQVTCQKG